MSQFSEDIKMGFSWFEIEYSPEFYERIIQVAQDPDLRPTCLELSRSIKKGYSADLHIVNLKERILAPEQIEQFLDTNEELNRVKIKIKSFQMEAESFEREAETLADAFNSGHFPNLKNDEAFVKVIEDSIIKTHSRAQKRRKKAQDLENSISKRRECARNAIQMENNQNISDWVYWQEQFENARRIFAEFARTYLGVPLPLTTE